MRAVVQRVSRASVAVAGAVVGQIGRGWLVLLGVAKGDGDDDADRLAAKVVGLRAFADEVGKMNLDLVGVGGSALIVSQFTLMADCRGGRRPSFTEAADPTEAERLYRRFVEQVHRAGVEVATGVFRADMQVRRLVRISCLIFEELVQCLDHAGFVQQAADRREVPGPLGTHGRADVSAVGGRRGGGLRLGGRAGGE